MEWPAAWELLCVDEATVHRHPTLTAQWCLVDEVPEVPTGDDHAKVQVYGAVAPLTGRTQLGFVFARGCDLHGVSLYRPSRYPGQGAGTATHS